MQRQHCPHPRDSKRPRHRRMLRRMKLEALEGRSLLASDFCNSFNEFDVNDDGVAAPLDALIVMRELNDYGARDLAGSQPQPGRFLDVSGDRFLSPHDALLLINHL